MPKNNSDNSSGFLAYHGGLIFVVEFKYELVNIMLTMLKNHIINSNHKITGDDASQEMRQLWDFIKSPMFVTQFRLLYSNMKKVEMETDKIDSVVRKQIAKQKKVIASALDVQREIILSLVKSVGTKSLPKKLMNMTINHLHILIK